MDVLLARQPIFDRDDRLVAYELLYRSNVSQNWAGGASVARMSTDVVINAFIEMGVERVTDGKLAFVNCSREMLLSGALATLDRSLVVIELLEHVEPDEEVVAQCRELVSLGFRLALDDFVYTPAYDALMELRPIVKLDVLDRSAAEVEAAMAPLRRWPATFLAERVENAEVRDYCRALGFELFQGYFFQKPEVLAKRGVTVDQVQLFSLFNQLNNDTVHDSRIEETFRGNPALTFKLLRMVNAASMGGRGVESIGHAMRLLGRAALGRWIGLLLVSSVAGERGTDQELVRAALIRARLSELLASAGGRSESAGPLFMVGLFSLMDALMRTPMAEIVERLDLTTPVRDALLGRGGPYAIWLQHVEAYESADWEAVRLHATQLGIPLEKLSQPYLDAVAWTQDRLRSMA
jgi:c-di-GMP phosphodiesterase